MKLLVVAAIYDLRVLPATFDILNFMCTAYARATLIYKSKDIVIQPILVTGQIKQERQADFIGSYSQDIINERIASMLLPSLDLLDFCLSPIILPSLFGEAIKLLMKKMNVVYPIEYSLEKPKLYKYYKNFHVIKAASITEIRRLKINRYWKIKAENILNSKGIYGDFILLVERRNADSLQNGRDSDIKYVSRVGNHLSKKFKVVLLRDLGSEKYDNLDRIIQISPIESLPCRAALMEKALLCILPNGGISTLSHLNQNVRYIMYELISKNSFTEDWYLKNGFQPGTNPFSPKTKTQRWFWKRPSVEEMISVCNEIINLR